jgi:hypothetical protein
LFLGLPQVLPRLVTPDADRVKVFRHGEMLESLKVAADGMCILPSRPMEGPYLFEAYADEQFIDDLPIRFVPSTAAVSFKRATEPRRWLREPSREPQATLNEPDEWTCRDSPDFDAIGWVTPGIWLGPRMGELWRSRTERAEWFASKLPRDARWKLAFIGDRSNPKPPLREIGPVNPAQSWKHLPRLWKEIVRTGILQGGGADVEEHLTRYRKLLTAHADELTPFTGSSENVKPGLVWHPALPGHGVTELESALAAHARRRSGLDMGLVHELFGLMLNLADPFERWECIRAWVEAGCLELVTDKRWSSQTLFAVPPRFVLHQRAGRLHATLMGLTTEAVRSHVHREFAVGGAEVSNFASVSGRTPSRLGVANVDLERLHACSVKLGLEAPVWLEPPSRWLTSVESVVTREVSPPLASYKEVREWSWSLGVFLHLDPALAQPVTLQRYTRPDAPALYVLTVDGRFTWSTPFRNWALLAGHHFRGEQPFTESGPHVLVRMNSSRAHLPSAVGRFLTAIGGLAPGPTPDGYVYAFPSETARNEIFGRLWPKASAAY